MKKENLISTKVQCLRLVVYTRALYFWTQIVLGDLFPVLVLNILIMVSKFIGEWELV